MRASSLHPFPAAALALCALAGCSMLSAPGGGFNLISVEDEWRMGLQLEAEVAKQMEVISDPRIDGFINELGGDLLAATDNELARLDWTFHVVKDDSINAFNIPGGHVYINTGLVTALGDYAELASVVGHEIGHGLSRHGTRQLSTQYGISFVLALALGNDPGAIQQIVAQFAATGTLLKFSRDDELQADRFGVHLTYGAGIDPQGVVDMLGVLASLRNDRPSAIESFLASHPDPEVRVGVARERVSTLPPRPGLVRQTSAFREFQKRVAALAPGS